MPQVGNFACPSCQKEYRWKSELAGKRVKCKCGGVLTVPEAEPSAELADDFSTYELSEPDEPAKLTGVPGVASAAAVDEGNQFRCPYCGQDIEVGSAVCVYCGSQLSSGEKASSRASQRAAPPPVARPVVMRKQPKGEIDAGSKGKLIISAVGLVILVIAAVAGMKYFAGKGGTSKVNTSNMMQSDKDMLAKIDDENGTEARKWLENDSHNVMGLSTKQAKYRVDEFYRMGAKQVLTFGARTSTTLAIELPDDKDKRKEIFDWTAKYNKENFFKHDPDVGQKWLEVQMKP